MINITIKMTFRDDDKPRDVGNPSDIVVVRPMQQSAPKQITMQRAGWFARWFGLKAGEYR